jgi:hypothetical protein
MPRGLDVGGFSADTLLERSMLLGGVNLGFNSGGVPSGTGGASMGHIPGGRGLLSRPSTANISLSSSFVTQGMATDGKIIIAVGTTTGGADTAVAIRSVDMGRTWTEFTLPVSTQAKSIVYHNGRWVVSCGNNTSKGHVLTSSDGFVWSVVTLSHNRLWYAAGAGAGVFLLMTYADLNTQRSFDGGFNWTAGTGPSGNFRSIVFHNGHFIAVSDGGGSLYVSRDLGGSWTGVNTGLAVGSYRITKAGGLLFAGAQSGAPAKVAVSSDGFTWTVVTLPSAILWNDLASCGVQYIGDRFVIVSSATGLIHESVNGYDWFKSDQTVDVGGADAIVNGPGFLAAVAGSPTTKSWRGRVAMLPAG